MGEGLQGARTDRAVFFAGLLYLSIYHPERMGTTETMPVHTEPLN